MISAFELFKIGIGPSSSHTVGPMVAAASFIDRLDGAGMLARAARVETTLFGSLAWTGRGHGTDKAVILGLAGERPRTVDPDRADALAADVASQRRLALAGRHMVRFESERDMLFDGVSATPRHPNTLAFRALDASGNVLAEERWCSIGGGFVVPEDEVGRPPGADEVALPHPFRNARDLLVVANKAGLTIAELVFANEVARRPSDEVMGHLDGIVDAMMACVDRGIATSGELPGGLKVRRRAKAIHDTLISRNARTPHEVMDWVSLYAIAVNEENAAGGRVVTAPTNGAAGVVPATLRYYLDHCSTASRAGMHAFLLTATAIGALFKMNASISGAEVGCQGEVGVACSMAAAGLAAALGGSNEQIENAAEIGMEHHLGMTCDPIGGLVQVPCIERNAFGAISAVNAASLALHGDGTHIVSLDKVIATMRETGRDMASKYKETSLGGLAVNLPEC
ncbi:L-serine ammonia-lyase [Ancylobacter amanitiformis]|uniref:L-serine dehydratase n=1 Tax=Ancylobacter amanitiformis TaxID=217069 RepID=A0ABU0LNW8_9HYPH|nr:L-serine ammonia-lyase [Ancylobacter amanitiformis]MDQ0510359.1 L-serine dehydratase [Ancylobacter amanitiformis]